MFYSKKLKKFSEINHCFFSKKGGYSKGIYKGLNCGRGSKDNKNNIVRNLNFVSKKMLIKRKNLILMHQTHSNRVFEIKKDNYKSRVKSDAIITKMRGIALGVVTADCAPILLYDKKSKIIASIHAGWKGAFSGIINKTVLRMNKLNPKGEIFACVGPCIGKSSYEVGYEFFNLFMNKSKRNRIYFHNKSKNKKFFNLRMFVADILKKLDVRVDHISRDTFKDKNNFFSHRRSIKTKQNDYGRCISVISLV